MGLSLIAAPFIGLVTALLVPKFGDDLGEELEFVASSSTLWMVGTFGLLLANFLLIPAVLGILHLLRKRGAVLGHIGGGLALLGIYFHAVVLGFAHTEVPLAQSALTKEDKLELVNLMFAHDAFTMVLIPFIGFYIGMLLLAVALWRAKVAPIWVPASIIAGLLAPFAAPTAINNELMFLLLLVGLGWLGLKVLRTEDAEWELGELDTAEVKQAGGQVVLAK